MISEFSERLAARAKLVAEEARKRWPGMGGWVAKDPKTASHWSVGYLRDTPHGPERVTMGSGNSPEEALDSADRRLARLRDAESKPHLKGPPKAPREGRPYPIAGDLFDDA